MKQKIQQFTKDLLAHPEPEKLRMPHRGLRTAIDIWPLLSRKLQDDNLPMRASALTYRMIFGLVPMLVLGLIVFKALVGMDKIEATVTEWSHKAFETSDGSKDELRQQADEIIRTTCSKAGSVDLKSVGIMGVVMLLWAAVSLIVTAEKVFNKIYQSPLERPWIMRVPIYWAAMTLGPLCIAGSLIASEKIFAAANNYVGDTWVFGPLLKLAGSVMGTFVTWILLFALYKTLPAVKVAFRPALIGSLIAALAIEVLKFVLFAMVFAKGKDVDPAKKAIYGTLALLPIALFWTYISWFIVLAGLEVSWVAQSLGFLKSQAAMNRARHAQELLAAESAMLLPAMVAVGHAFQDGKAVAEAQLCRTLSAPGSVVRPLMEKLVKAGFLHDVLGEDGNADGFRDWGLARSPQQIKLDDLLALLPVPNPDVPGLAMMKQSREAQINAVKGMTLADAL